MTIDRYSLQFDLGTFEGFSFSEPGALENILTAQEVVNWDHDRQGEAEFWPSGEHAGVFLVFRNQTAVTVGQILELDRLLAELGDDSLENFIRIYHAMTDSGCQLSELSRDSIEDRDLHIFLGQSFYDLHQRAAYELFELYYPEAYAMWERTPCDGLIFDPHIFLGSPSFYTEELSIPGTQVLLVSPR